MRRSFSLAAVGLLLLISPAPAALVVSFENVPTTYVPGVDFVVDLVVDGPDDIFAYSLNVLLAGSGTAGVDYFFAPLNDSLSDLASPADYILDEADNNGRNSIQSVDLGGNLRLAFSDFENNPSPTGGRYVARLTIRTTAAAGTLALSIDPDPMVNFFVDDVEGDIPFTIPDELRITPLGVPEPSTLALGGFGLAGLALAARRRVRRAA